MSKGENVNDVNEEDKFKEDDVVSFEQGCLRDESIEDILCVGVLEKKHYQLLIRLYKTIGYMNINEEDVMSNNFIVTNKQ